MIIFILIYKKNIKFLFLTKKLKLYKYVSCFIITRMHRENTDYDISQ